MENHKQEVTITLNQSNRAQAFKQEALIHQSEFERIKKVIYSQLKKIEERSSHTSYSVGGMLERMHNAIAILGERGTGKTSFLYTVIGFFKSGRYLEDAQCDTKLKVDILGIIDPTLLEEKAHVFLLIVSIINEKVMTKLNGSQCCVDEDAYRKISHWKISLKKLAKGLPSLDKIGTDYRNDNWQDAEYIMDKGLEDVLASYNLDKYFNQLVDEALEILEKDAFMIGFDDIDINFDKGWRVLETIRKYLCSSKFIILMCGNLKLYNLNVRQQQSMMLNIPDISNCKEATEMIYQLENQYMMKVFKSQNRVHLSTIIYSQNWNDIIYSIKGVYNGKVEIMEVYKEVLGQIGIKTYMRSFVNYLLNTSIRTQINYLRTNWDLSETEKHKFNVRRIDAFISRMFAGEINVNVVLNNPNLLVISSLNYLINTKSIKDLYQLIPTSENEGINACLMGLTTIFSWYVRKNPFLIFDYLLRIGYVRNLIQLESNDDKTLNLVNSASLKEDISLKNVVGLCMAYQKHAKLFSMAEHKKLFDETKAKRIFLTLVDSINSGLISETVNYYVTAFLTIDKSRDLGENAYRLQDSENLEILVTKCFYRALEKILARDDKWALELMPLFKGNAISDDYIIKKIINLPIQKLGSELQVNVANINTYLACFLNPLIKGLNPDEKIYDVQKILVYLPLCSLKFSKHNYSNLYYSFYNLLGAIGEFLKIRSNSPGLSEYENRKSIKKLLYDLQLIRNYQIPDDINEDSKEIQTLLSDSDIHIKEERILKTFIDAISEWMGAYDIEFVPPYLLGKIATRFFYNVQKIKKDNLGEQMKCSVEAFLKTCCIIESEENISSDVHIEIGENLYDNLRIEDISYKLPLTSWLINCPLLYPFLDYSLYNEIEFPLYSRTRQEMRHPKFNVYEILGGTSKKKMN